MSQRSQVGHSTGPIYRYTVRYADRADGPYTKVADEWMASAEAVRDLILSDAYTSEETPPGFYEVVRYDGSRGAMRFEKAALAQIQEHRPEDHHA